MSTFFQFTGRINRQAFIQKKVILFTVFWIVTLMIMPIYSDPLLLIYAPFVIILMVSHISLTLRRLMDMGRSPWHYLLLFIPIYGFYLKICLIFIKGDGRANLYGFDPLAGLS